MTQAAVRSSFASPEALHWALLREVAKSFGTVQVEGRRVRLCWSIAGRRTRIDTVRLTGGLRVRLTEPIAHEILQDIRSAIRRGVPPDHAVMPYLPGGQFLEAWKLFVASRRAKLEQGRLSSQRLAELESYERRGYFRFWRGAVAADVTPAKLEDFRDWLFTEFPHLRPKTIRNVLADSVTGLRWLHRRGIVLAPPEMPEVTSDEYVPDVPPARVLLSVLNEIPEPKRGLFLVRSLMGLRPSEARRLRICDYDWRSSRMTLSRTKTRRFRHLEAPPVVATWLEERTPAERRLVSTAALFVNPETDSGWHPSSERRIWIAACKALGVRIRPNEGGRHFFATAAVASGTELGTLQRYLGHVDPKTTQRYIRLVAMGRIDVLRNHDEPSSPQ